MISETLGFLGYGNMGAAIAEGLIGLGAIEKDRVLAFDPSPDRMAAAREAGIACAASLPDLVAGSSVLLLAVKPQIMGAVLDEVRPHCAPDSLVISIAAGISTGFIQERLGADTAVVRVMPNTPYLVHAGAAGIAASPQCSDAQIFLAREIFASMGIAELVDESALDAITALSGSGPAYFFYLVECLVEAAAAQGLDRAVAERLAAQTLVGAGKLLQETGEPAETLRKKVTSPGGTTEAALNAYRDGGLDALVADAVAAAVRRSRELGA
ncbi:MAG: pyrroline-5-carboxylate reductase [Candidatus Hydrogenedentes bacterium]|nr:pyrroline-5-carboxylate reductase [Candidatus Hydrogenedentota bacterium]